MSGFLPFPKASKWTNISQGIRRIWMSMLEYIPSAYIGSWTYTLKVMRVWFHFGSDWYEWTAIMNEKKRPDHLWPAVSGSLVFILFPSSSLITVSVKIKRLGQTQQCYEPWSQRSYPAHFPTGFSPGLPCKKTDTQGSNLCVPAPYLYWN